jgi:uncharacterized protein (DUF1499 family)
MNTHDSPPPPATDEPKPRPSRVALVGVGLAVLAALALLLAGLGTRWGLWDFRTGFSILRWAAYGGLLALIVSLVGAVTTRPGTPRRGFPLAVLGLVLGLLVVAVPWRWQLRARSVPPIHDITTDTENPPEFVAIVPLRADAPNPVEYGGPEIAAQQHEAYPDVRPLLLELPRERAFQRALDTAREMGWEVVSAAPAAGRIEATDRTRWFGFYDDVVIRITPVGEARSVIDVRSLSRVGRGDVGANAHRIRDYLAELEE